MVGFGLDGYEGRIPCPHCGSTDCCGVDGDRTICIHTKKPVTVRQLRESAKKHGIKSIAESMIFHAVTVEEIKKDNPGMPLDKVYEKHHADNWNELKRIDEEAKKSGSILYRFIREQVADGIALYQIVKVNRKTVRVQHLTGFSEYRMRYWPDNTMLDRDFAESEIRGRDTLNELFNKKEE